MREPVEQQEPEEPEVPKRDKKDMWLTDLEYEVRNALRAGKALTIEQVNMIVELMVVSPEASTKGFVIDLTFAKNDDDQQWGARLLENNILDSQYGTELTHIVELQADDDEVKKRARNLLITPMNGVVYSDYERR